MSDDRPCPEREIRAIEHASRLLVDLTNVLVDIEARPELATVESLRRMLKGRMESAGKRLFRRKYLPRLMPTPPDPAPVRPIQSAEEARDAYIARVRQSVAARAAEVNAQNSPNSEIPNKIRESR